MSEIIREQNTILEINEAHSDNYIIVFPKLPTSKFVSSGFNNFVTPSSSGCSTLNTNLVQREANLDLANFKLYLKSFTLPTVNIADYEVPTQFATMKRSGKIGFTDFSTKMMVSENFINYNIILYWLYALHNIEEYNKLAGFHYLSEFYVDVYLIITNNHREKVGEYRFMDCFPKSLNGFEMTCEEPNKLMTEITWAHSGMWPSNQFVLKYV